jgi:hypothetical protein
MISPWIYTSFFIFQSLKKRKAWRKAVKKGNPFALCKWLAKKHRWKKAKTEKCILSVKKGMRKRGVKV